MGSSCAIASAAAIGGGGSFEAAARAGLFDADGLLARNELFDPDRVAEALARFDD
jgi:hypothetical protein